MKSGSLASTTEEPVSHNARLRKRVIVRGGEVPHLTQVARSSFPCGESAPAHVHPDMWEIFICEEGTGFLIVNGHPIALTPGTWVLVEPGEVHEVRSSADNHLILSVIGLENSPRSIASTLPFVRL